jgi:nitrite reductase/ring-hydroxylating ferredoxin subunit
METTHECQTPDRSNYEVIDPQITRRKLLKIAAIGLAAFGLGAQADAAYAASTKVKAGKASAVPVKGAKGYQLNGKYIIVTQPKSGTFKAFSGVCTHQPQNITSLSGTNLVCRAHNGKFDTTTGKPTGGPVFKGLTTYVTTVTNGDLYVTL